MKTLLLLLLAVSGAGAQGIVNGGGTNAAATATALAANGANCSAGSYALGVDASGASESCTVDSEANTYTSSKTFTNGVGVTGGNVGIGTVSPDAKLHVNGGAAGATMRMTNDGTNINSLLFAMDYDGTTNYAVIGQGTDGSLVLGGASSIASGHVFVTDAGNVGIGTASPGSALDVFNVVGGTKSLTMGAWLAWVPTYGGITSPSTSVARYIVIGKTVCIILRASGTGSLTTQTFTLPFNSKNSIDALFMGLAQDNGTLKTTTVGSLLTAGSATVSLFVSPDEGTAWTASGARSFSANGCYEIE